MNICFYNSLLYVQYTQILFLNNLHHISQIVNVVIRMKDEYEVEALEKLRHERRYVKNKNIMMHNLMINIG